MSLKTIKCPHCGYFYRIDLEAMVERDHTTLVRGTNENCIRLKVEIIDLTCPNCGKVFEWPVI